MVEIKKLPKSKVEITVSVSWDEWKNNIEKAVENFSKNMKLDGFRPGRAPRQFVEQKVGTLALLEEAAEMAIQKAYPEVLEKEKIEAIGSPRAEITKLAEGNDLEFKITTSVVPEITLKPWKESIRKINEEYKDKKTDASPEEIEDEIGKLASSRAKFVTVRREAKNDDTVILDFQVLRDGIPIENGTSKNHPLVLGKGVFIPGFEEKIVGMKENEEKEFELKFPDEYHEKSLAGKPATFKVKVNVVQEREVPELNDEFAKSLGKFENMEELRKSVSEGMTKENEYRQKEERRGKYLDELVKLSEIELPEVLVHEEIHKMIHEFEDQISMMGMDMESYLERIKKTREELEEEWHPQAEKRVISALALEAIAKNDEIAVPAEEIESEMNKTMQKYKNIKDAEKNIDLGKLYAYVKGVLTNEKVFEALERI